MHDHAAIAERYRLEASHAWFNARQRLIIWAVRKYFSQAENFLEIGVGTGVMLSAIAEAFPNMQAYGADYEHKNLLFLSNHIKIKKLIQLDAKRQPFDSSLDLVGIFDVLEHIEEDVQVLKEINRSLKPEGGVIITVPQHPFLWSKYDEYDGVYDSHKRRYTRKELTKKMTEAGFHIIAATSFVSLLLPVLAISRLFPLQRPVTPTTGLTSSYFFNSLMDRIFQLEFGLIKRGVDFPAGGSLLLLARK